MLYILQLVLRFVVLLYIERFMAMSDLVAYTVLKVIALIMSNLS